MNLWMCVYINNKNYTIVRVTVFDQKNNMCIPLLPNLSFTTIAHALNVMRTLTPSEAEMPIISDMPLAIEELPTNIFKGQ